MRFKKTAIGVTLLLIIIFLNQYKKQDVFTLTDQGREVPDGIKVLFFSSFMPDNFPCSVLSGNDARNLLHKIKHEAYRTNAGVVHPNNRLHGIMGNLCITPQMDDLFALHGDAISEEVCIHLVRPLGANAVSKRGLQRIVLGLLWGILCFKRTAKLTWC